MCWGLGCQDLGIGLAHVEERTGIGTRLILGLIETALVNDKQSWVAPKLVITYDNKAARVI